MTIRVAKTIIKDFIKKNCSDNELLFNRDNFSLIYNKNNYLIEFYFFVDNYGGKICIMSQCVYRLKIIQKFYSDHNLKYNARNNFGENTITLYNIYNDLNSTKKNIEYKISKDEDFDRNVYLAIEELFEMIMLIINKLKTELESNLETQFDKRKLGVFEFNSTDLVILYHFFKPKELLNYLEYLKNEYSNQEYAESSFNEYKILLKKICELNNFDYQKLEPKLSFINKLKSIFKLDN